MKLGGAARERLYGNSCPLSVIIPCYNSGHYLTEAVASVLDQEPTSVEVEIVVVDDHSSDPNTLEILSRLESVHREVRVIHNAKCSGPAVARNVGIASARGEWIAFLDSDDVWVPGGLRARWQVVETSPDAQWVGADFVYWYEDGSCEQEGFYKTRHLSVPFVRPAYESGRPLRFVRPVREFLNCLLTWISTAFVKKDLLQRVGGFDERLRGSEDFHLWIKLAQAADFHFVPTIVARYRQHGESLTRTKHDLSHWRGEALRLLLLDPAFQPYKAAIEGNLTVHHWEIAYHYLECGERWRATHHAANVVLRKPLWAKGWKRFLGAVLGRKLSVKGI